MKYCRIHFPEESFRAKVCDTYWSQARGLLFSKEKAALFVFKKPRRISVHMFFMSRALDILWLDEKMRIVEMKRNLKPWTFYIPKKKAMYMLEVPAGRSKSLNGIEKINTLPH